ncbi:MAG: sigma 54-interacting transcriptional regulator [Bryobacteraceae bacterium]|nr:sigma 54-interacting transcriptional regulator [Bryobacteraceae bacterium]
MFRYPSAGRRKDISANAIGSVLFCRKTAGIGAMPIRASLSSTAERYQALLDLSQSIVSHKQIATLLSDLSVSLKRIVDFDGISVTLYNPADRTIKLLAVDVQTNTPPVQPGKMFCVDETPAGIVMQTGQPLYRPDMPDRDNDPHPLIYDPMRSIGIRSHVILPMSTAHHPFLGGLNFGSLQYDAYCPEDIEFMKQVARQVAVAIENATNFEALAEYQKQLAVERDQLRLLNLKLAEEKLYLEDEIRDQFRFGEIIGRSPALVSVLRQVETVATSDSAVVICGETGTGKELVARAIHDLSTRKNNTFVKINCAAIPNGLIESELFGHERGAFTGAIARRIGRFELADSGTLFLDEIGEIPVDLQPKLLRVLQEQEFERVGSSRTIKVNVRVVAATNRDLMQMVRDRCFRDDLYYRLNVFPILIPPLRNRRDDIPVLVRHFAQQFARRMGKQIITIPTEAMEAMLNYPWPGNVRELQNVVERAVIVSQGSILQVPREDLKAFVQDVPNGPAITLEDAERDHILDALRATNWKLAGPNGAAARLGMKRSTLQFRLKKLGILKP